MAEQSREPDVVDGVGEEFGGRLSPERQSECRLERSDDERHVVLVAHIGCTVQLLGDPKYGSSRVEGVEAGTERVRDGRLGIFVASPERETSCLLGARGRHVCIGQLELHGLERRERLVELHPSDVRGQADGGV